MGWLPAAVAADFQPNEFKEEDMSTWVRVTFYGPFRDPIHGHCDSLKFSVHPQSVHSQTKPPLMLSLFCVSCWDYVNDLANDGMLQELLNGPHGVHDTLSCEYEVHQAFIKHSQDVARINASSTRNLLRAPSISAWYFLRPVKHVESQGVAMKIGDVCEHPFFGMCQQMERAGIPTGWPHPCHLWRLLCGEFWAPQMCLNRGFKVPATSRVHFAEFSEAPEETAVRVIECVRDLRRHANVHPDESPDELKGVVKFGFSWNAEDVLPFCGVQSLVQVLTRLFKRPGSSQIVCIVQEMVPEVVCELRLLCIHDALKSNELGEDVFAKECIWMPMKGEMEGLSIAADIPVDDKEARYEFFSGNKDAQKSAEAQAFALADKWFLWFCTECPDPPHAIRLDFMVSYSPVSDEASLWTCGVQECSAPIDTVHCGARNAAVVNSAMRFEESSSFPKQLPVMQRIWDSAPTSKP